MLNTNTKTIIIAGLISILTSNTYAADCSQLANVDQQKSCKKFESKVIPQLTNGVSGGICKYHKKTIPCNYETNIADKFEDFHKVRKDHYWHDHEIVALCNSRIAHSRSGNDYAKSSSIEGQIIRGRSCYKRDWRNKCVKWNIKVTYKCKLDMWRKHHDANVQRCPQVDDASRPKECKAAHKQDYALVDDKLTDIKTISSLIETETKYLEIANELATKLILSKNDISNFVYSEEDIIVLKTFIEDLAARSLEDGAENELLKVSILLDDVITKIEHRSATGSNIQEDIEAIEQQIAILKKEKVAKAHYSNLVNTRIKELEDKKAQIMTKF